MMYLPFPPILVFLLFTRLSILLMIKWFEKKFNLPFDLIHVGESPKTKSAVRTVVCPSRMEGVKENPFHLISSEILWWNYDFIGRTIFVTVKHQVTVLKICAPSTRCFFFLHYNLAENKFLSLVCNKCVQQFCPTS